MRNTINMQLVGLGGQGILTFTKILSRALARAGRTVLYSEVHGLSQRGGSIHSTIRVGEEKSQSFPEADTDIIVGFEPYETFRCLMTKPVRVHVISNTCPTLPLTAYTGYEHFPTVEEVLSEIRERARLCLTIDASQIADSVGSRHVMNSVLLGAQIASGLLPVGTDEILEVMEEALSPHFLSMNKEAFFSGFRVIRHKIGGPEPCSLPSWEQAL